MSSFPPGSSLICAVVPRPPLRRRFSSNSTSAASATRPTMSSFPIQSHETSVFELKINKMLLSCTYCCQPLRPDLVDGISFTCAGGHIFCRGCTSQHQKACISNCSLLDDIIAQMKFKCNYCDSGDELISYPKFLAHMCNTRIDPRVVERQVESVFVHGNCILNTSLLVCSKCELPLRPPIFKHFSQDVTICSACYCGDIANFVHCSELDYLVQGITVKCVACEEYLPFYTLASHQLDNCPMKHKLQKIATVSSAWKNLCDEEETKIPKAENNSIHGKNKRKVHFGVGKMDKHVFQGDEVTSDDDSCDASYDDNLSETGKRVAETALDTSSCNKRAKTATPSGQKHR